MSEQQKDPWMEEGGPAFPTSDGVEKNYKGMSLRDYFAAKAMQGIAADPSFSPPTYDEVARISYDMADAMLKARAE